MTFFLCGFAPDIYNKVSERNCHKLPQGDSVEANCVEEEATSGLEIAKIGIIFMFIQPI